MYYDKFEQYLKNTIKEMFKIQSVDTYRDFEDYGFTSISNVELVNRINADYSLDILPTIIFELPDANIRSLAMKICDKYGRELERFYSTDNTVKSEKTSPVIPEITRTEKRKEIHPTVIEKKSRFIHNELKEEPCTVPEIEKMSEGLSKLGLKEPVAIIGMAGKYPQSNDLKEFWNNISEGKNLITEVPSDRFDWTKYDDPTLRWGGFINDIDKFDAKFFNISKVDAETMDPQHRLFIEMTWKAIEDAGYKISDLSGTRTSLFIGIGTQDYAEIMSREQRFYHSPYAFAGREAFMLCNRISTMLNIHGSSEAIYTTCSSSLLSVLKGVEAIRSGDSEVAIVGGVNAILSPTMYHMLSFSGMLSPTGESRAFDAKADGTVRSEGVGAMILKSLSAAQRDNDHIYAVIRSAVHNHKGSSTSLIAPNQESEKQLIIDSFHQAGVAPDTVNYFEAHSTGTLIGDSIEFNAIKDALSELSRECGCKIPVNSCAISSVKPNVGHLETASGICALMKVVLSMQHKMILGINNLKEQSKYIINDNTPLYLNRENSTWKRVSEDIPRRAGVSSFGFGGVNVHLIVEEYDDSIRNARVPQNEETAIIVLSAKTREQLREYAFSLCSDLSERCDSYDSLNDIAYTLQNGRDAYNERMAFSADSIREAIRKLNSYLDNKDDDIYTGSVSNDNDILRLFENDISLDGVVKHLITDRNFNKLMKLWVNGFKIDWKQLYTGSQPHRLSIPTYPFEKDRYWVDSGEICNNKEIIIEKKAEKKGLQLPKSENKNELIAVIDNVFYELLGEHISNINQSRALSDYSIDSIVITQLLKSIQPYNDTLDFEVLYGCSTVRELIDTITGSSETSTNQIAEPSAETIDKVGEENKGEAEMVAIASERQRISELIKKSRDIEQKNTYRELVRLNRSSDKTPVFWFHGGFGGVEAYRVIAQISNRPLYGIEAKGYLNDDYPILGIEEMAAYYIKIMKSVQKSGPYDLGGLSMGGIIAFEVARQLQDMGEKVNSIVMLESIYQDIEIKKTWTGLSTKMLKKERMLRAANLLLGFTSVEQFDLISEKEIDIDLTDDQFLEELVKLSMEKGCRKPYEILKKNIVNLEVLLHTLDISSSIYEIEDLPDKDNVKCYYFCNDNSSLFSKKGALEYFQIGDKEYKFDYIECSEKWKIKIPALERIQIKSSSHFTILSDDTSYNIIKDFCKKLYS